MIKTRQRMKKFNNMKLKKKIKLNRHKQLDLIWRHLYLEYQYLFLNLNSSRLCHYKSQFRKNKFRINLQSYYQPLKHHIGQFYKHLHKLQHRLKPYKIMTKVTKLKCIRHFSKMNKDQKSKL